MKNKIYNTGNKNKYKNSKKEVKMYNPTHKYMTAQCPGSLQVLQ